MLILLSSGSNAHGQLGSGCLYDFNTFQRCSFAGNPPHVLPVGSSRILVVAMGANHTILLLEFTDSYGNKTRQLWGCGDGRKGQLGLKYRKDTLEGASTSVFRRIELALDEGGLGGYIFKFAAATWETSYIVLTCEGKGDAIISMGSNDYGDLGIGGLKGKGEQSPPDFDVLRFDHLSMPSGVHLVSENLKIEAISCGQRHVVVHLQISQSTPSLHPLQLLVGWGMSRHGQLGSSMSSSNEKPSPFTSLPKVVPIPSDNTLPNDRIASSSLGIHHSVFLHKSGRLSAVGSNRKRQLQVVENDPFISGRVQSVACTWNGTYLIVQDDQHWTVYSSGSNSHSQLGWGIAVDNEILKGSAAVTFSDTLDPHRTSIRLACGSEHVLALITELASQYQQVWGWGWNEHGNLGTGNTYDVPAPVRIWPPSDEPTKPSHIDGIWAGCGTSWIAYSDD